MIPEMIMLAAVRKDFFTRRRLPAEHCRLVKAYQCPVAMCAHVEILYSCIGKVLGKAPADTVDVVLHGE